MRGERLLEVAWLVRCQDLCSGFGAAGEIDEERSPQSFIELAAVQQRLHVEIVARVLTRQGRRDLACIEVREVEHLHFGKSEVPFDSGPHAHRPHWMDCAAHYADLFFEVITRRYQNSPVILSTNKPFGEWNQVFPNAGCVVTLVDRLMHKAEILTLAGKSYRLKEAQERAARNAKSRADKKPKKA